MPMRIAVISDIHGNCFALDAALDDLHAQGVQQTVCLGDAIQGGAQPAETVQRLRALSCPVVMGNADAWLLDDAVEPTTPEQGRVREWTRSQLSADELAFIGAFQPTVAVALGGGKQLLCFHGSPASYHDVLLPETPDAEWQRLLAPVAPAFMAGGHTHTQQVRHIGEGLFFNPGSIGLVYDVRLADDQRHQATWAEYAILSDDSGGLSLDLRRVPYDVERLIQIIRASGRPQADKLIAEYRRGPTP